MAKLGSRLNGIQEARGSNLNIDSQFIHIEYSALYLYELSNIRYNQIWGRSAAGSAFEWHSKGREFESHRLHQ